MSNPSINSSRSDASGFTANQVFTRLQEAIVSGDIAPGSKLKEAVLSKEFGISRAPLREALNRLCERRLIKKIPNVGAQVVELSEREIDEIYQIRENLEALACRLAASNMTDAEINALGVLLKQHQAYLDQQGGRRYMQQQGDLDFHFCIIQGSKNSMLTDLLCGELYQLVRMIRCSGRYLPSRPALALQEHQQIFKAISQRDGELAAMLMTRHIRRARQEQTESTQLPSDQDLTNSEYNGSGK